MALTDSDYPIFDVDETLLPKALFERVNPNGWPFSLDDLPVGCALVGGSVRDALLNRLKIQPDLDIIVPSEAVRLTRQLAKRLNAKCVVLDQERDIARLIVDKWTIDFAKQIGESLQDDLSRRDFTINAIALTLGSNIEIIDPFNGLKDLKKNTLVAISEENLISDPLRMLRGLRLLAEFNFFLEDKTYSLFDLNAELLAKKVSPERIKYEIQRLINGDYADFVIPLLKRTGLLNPWRDKSKVSISEEIGLKASKEFQCNELSIALPLARLVDLISDRGLCNLRFSKKEIQACKVLRKWQKRNDGSAFSSLNEFDLFNLHLELENHLPALIIDLPLDSQSVWLKRWRDPFDPLFHPSSPLNGNTIQEILNVKKGPFLGEIIEHLSREKAFNRLHTYEEAIELARNLWHQK
tara:strand:+ start:13104 stop:14333 length:1230 start_codon:yes stop_codon:yes gene_type:complete